MVKKTIISVRGLQKLIRLFGMVIAACMVSLLFGCGAPETQATASDASRIEISASAITDVSQPDGSGYYTCDYNGVQRKYTLYIPKSIGENAPLVFMMHGYASNPKSFADLTGMNGAAEKYGFAVVYPQGIRNEKGTSGACWNSGLVSSDNDDAGFLVALAKYLQQTYGLSSNETFAVGLSNGAFMSYKLACEAPDTFRAVASVAGSMSGGAWDERPASASVGILQINGTEDEAVPLDGSMSASGGYGDAPDIIGIIEYWKNANHLEEYREFKLSDDATAYEYSSKLNDNLVWYVQIEDGGHEWPGEATAGFNASEVILEFFSRFVE